MSLLGQLSFSGCGLEACMAASSGRTVICLGASRAQNCLRAGCKSHFQLSKESECGVTLTSRQPTSAGTCSGRLRPATAATTGEVGGGQAQMTEAVQPITLGNKKIVLLLLPATLSAGRANSRPAHDVSLKYTPIVHARAHPPLRSKCRLFIKL